MRQKRRKVEKEEQQHCAVKSVSSIEKLKKRYILSFVSVLKRTKSSPRLA